MIHNYYKSMSIRSLSLSAAMFVLSFSLSGCHESMEKRCAREAREYTQKLCPAPIAKDIIIDSMGFDESTLTLNYYYSLKNKLDDPNVISHSKSSMHKQLLEAIRNTTSIKSYKDNGYNFGYTYYSSSQPNVILYHIVFHKKDYK